MARLTILTLVVLLTARSSSWAQEKVVVENNAKKPHPGLMSPKKASEKAPDEFEVKFVTTKGDFIVKVNRDWSPNGADRFYNLVRVGYFKDMAFFRAIEGFMVQFGIHGDPKVNEVWGEANIKDDPRNREVSNKQGFISFAKTGLPNSRSTQFFINLGNNARLDSIGFTPFGKITNGMENFKKINTEYGENPSGLQAAFKAEGNKLIKEIYPKIDFIKTVELIDPDKKKEESEKRK